MSDERPVVVVGAGLAGAAIAWALTRRGVPVVVLERFGAGHDRGSSHGSARIVRRAYGDALYVSLAGRAFELWREVEHESDADIIRMLGGLDFGAGRGVRTIADHMTESGVEHELLPADEATRRWPGMVFDGDVLYHPQAGTMDADGAVRALLALAIDAGAEVRHEAAATAVRPDPVVEVADGSVLSARCVVLAVGSWLAPLAGGLVALPPLQVTQQSIWHFPRVDPSGTPWPSVIHKAEHEVYHLAGGRDGGPGDDRKIGDHASNRDTTADTRDGVVDARAQQRITDYVRRWLPGLEPTPRTSTTCLYTRTPSEDFVIDRVGDLVVCSPCSGHGAKFAPLTGELVADLVTGRDGSVPDRFRLGAHAVAGAGAVSL